MKPKILLSLVLLAFVLSGCFVFSFYPLYTDRDLFPNTLLLGDWTDKDSVAWRFVHRPVTDANSPQKVDSTVYLLTMKEPGGEWKNSSFEVRVVRLNGTCFLDFYLKDYRSGTDPDWFDLHLVPVHTFARVTFEGNLVTLNWLDPKWLEELLKKNKNKIRHENNGNHILLTARTAQLQKFVVKSFRDEAAWKDGITVKLEKK